MSATRPYEEALLAPVEALIATALQEIALDARAEARFQLLEEAASVLAGFNYEWYRSQSANSCSAFLAPISSTAVAAIVKSIKLLPIHHALVLAALARPELTHSERRSGGVYYTDFRLAQFLAQPLQGIKAQNTKILDPACGSGILLVAAALAVADNVPERFSTVLGNTIYGADLCPFALRGAALALASLTSDCDAIRSLLGHLREADSLSSNGALWADVSEIGFSFVIGNPPWEKLKISRHELLTADGTDRHYGADYEENSLSNGWEEARNSMAEYVSRLDGMYALQGSGERDLYKFFLELSLRLTRPGGRSLLLVPAGLIRSLGTKHLRDYLMRNCSELEFTVMENRARFFGIDTRFKFVALNAKLAPNQRRSPVKLTTASGEPHGIVRKATVHISRSWLYEHRPDLSLPEVRSEDELRVFQTIAKKGKRFGASDGPWQPILMREVDMTRDRKSFCRSKQPDTVPLLEGRMVHQYRHAAKRYVSGSGRRATWLPMPANDDCEIVPQFWFPIDKLSDTVHERIQMSRVGFCDITGQTNERTMLAAHVPANVVCGNKVPTIVFGGTRSNDIADCWLGITNSFCFDWLIRRVVTTTVNYFLLLDLPFPDIDPAGSEGLEIARLAGLLGACSHAPSEPQETRVARRDVWHEAEVRAEVDWRVLHLYGHGVQSLQVMLNDFPLLDRTQPALPDEERSTITRDFIMLRAGEALGDVSLAQLGYWRERVEMAKEAGAVPYISSHLSMDA